MATGLVLTGKFCVFVQTQAANHPHCKSLALQDLDLCIQVILVSLGPRILNLMQSSYSAANWINLHSRGRLIGVRYQKCGYQKNRSHASNHSREEQAALSQNTDGLLPCQHG